MAYTKANLVDDVAGDAGADKATVERVLGAFFDTLVSKASGGNKVAWPGFGSFSVSQRSARTGRNPQTGAPVKIAASKAMKFSASSTLKERLNDDNRRRPLILVYDEAQNLSDQQTDLLLELQPDAFIVASATMRISMVQVVDIPRYVTAATRTICTMVTFTIRTKAMSTSTCIRSRRASTFSKASRCFISTAAASA